MNVVTRKRVALWPAGLLVWATTAFVVGLAATPAADGCDDRAIASASHGAASRRSR